MQTKQKRYLWAGVLAVFESRDEEKYITLNKRTNDALINPDVYSGFFGRVDNKKESFCPEIAAQRELLEEIFISSKDRKKVYNLVFLKGINNKESQLREPCFYTQRLIDLWKKEKRVDINKDNIFSLKPSSIIKEMDFIDHKENGRAKIFILNFRLPLDINNIRMFCGETRWEDPPEGLLDRRIDLFEAKGLKEWWLNNNEETIKAKISFKRGRRIKKGTINKVNCFSPNIALVFDKWWKS